MNRTKKNRKKERKKKITGKNDKRERRSQLIENFLFLNTLLIFFFFFSVVCCFCFFFWISTAFVYFLWFRWISIKFNNTNLGKKYETKDLRREEGWFLNFESIRTVIKIKLLLDNVCLCKKKQLFKSKWIKKSKEVICFKKWWFERWRKFNFFKKINFIWFYSFFCFKSCIKEMILWIQLSSGIQDYL